MSTIGPGFIKNVLGTPVPIRKDLAKAKLVDKAIEYFNSGETDKLDGVLEELQRDYRGIKLPKEKQNELKAKMEQSAKSIVSIGTQQDLVRDPGAMNIDKLKILEKKQNPEIERLRFFNNFLDSFDATVANPTSIVTEKAKEEMEKSAGSIRKIIKQQHLLPTGPGENTDKIATLQKQIDLEITKLHAWEKVLDDLYKKR